jgi:hypothetical protein
VQTGFWLFFLFSIFSCSPATALHRALVQTFPKFFTVNSLIRYRLFDSTEQFNIHTGLGLSPSDVTTPFGGNKKTPVWGIDSQGRLDAIGVFSEALLVRLLDVLPEEIDNQAMSVTLA